jgi:hypothetical protein
MSSSPNSDSVFKATQTTPAAAALTLEDRLVQGVSHGSMPAFCSAAQSGLNGPTSDGYTPGVAMDVCSAGNLSPLQAMDIDPGDGQHGMGRAEGSQRQTPLEVHLVNCQENNIITAKIVQIKLDQDQFCQSSMEGHFAQ